MKLSIIIPVYHEEKNIEKVIKQTHLKVKTPHETLIIYDTKKDPTYETVKKIITKYKNLKLVESSFGNKRGVINAIRTGLHTAKGETVAIVMADLSDEISIIDKMFGLINDGYDIVAASRYMKGGKKVGGPILKTLFSTIAGVSLYYLFNVPTRDATNAFKMYRKSIFKKITIESTGGFEYSLEIVLKAYKNGYKITEIPTIWYDRMEGKSNFKLFSWFPKYLKTYFIVFDPVFKKDQIMLAWKNWSLKINKKISPSDNLFILGLCVVFTLLLYIIFINVIKPIFPISQTTTINWLTINHYSKQQDYYLFFSFLGFTYFISLLFWFIWMYLKNKK